MVNDIVEKYQNIATREVVQAIYRNGVWRIFRLDDDQFVSDKDFRRCYEPLQLLYSPCGEFKEGLKQWHRNNDKPQT